MRDIEAWPEAHHLIKMMLRPVAEERITAQEILHHPFFWTVQQKMQFLITASDYFEFEPPTAPAVLAIDQCIHVVVKQLDWLPLLDPLLVDNLVRYRAYRTTSLRDLLRVMRNKYNHFRDLPPELQRVLGPLPDGFFRYFQTRFPLLLLTTYEVVRDFFVLEDVFKPYFYHRPSPKQP